MQKKYFLRANTSSGLVNLTENNLSIVPDDTGHYRISACGCASLRMAALACGHFI